MNQYQKYKHFSTIFSTEIFTACENFIQPEVVWSTSINYFLYKIGGIFTEGERYWLAKDRYTGHGFTLKLSTCKVSIAGVHVKNIAHRTSPSHNPSRATRSFRISGVLRDSGPWEQLLEEEFGSWSLAEGAPAPTLQTFYFKEAVEVQFLRFDLVSYWGTVGGGLDYFSVITVSGNLCSILVYMHSVLNRLVPLHGGGQLPAV